MAETAEIDRSADHQLDRALNQAADQVAAQASGQVANRAAGTNEPRPNPPPRQFPPPQRLADLTLAVENMNCGGCMRKVEKALRALPGVSTARVNLSAKRASVQYHENRIDAEAIIQGLAAAGYKAGELDERHADQQENHEKDFLRRLGVAGFAAMNVMLLSVSVWAGGADMSAPIQSLFHWLSALIALPAIVYAGQPFYRSALSALKARTLNMDVPISLGVVLASTMSVYQTARGADHVYFDAAITLLFFLLIGRYLDQRMRGRAQGAAQNLIGMMSLTATVIGDDGKLARVSAKTLEPGMRVLVAAGERVPVDGRIVSGRSDIDDALITGESVPRVLDEGAAVYAGTLNLSGPLTIEASATDKETLVAEIARLMDAAEQGRGRYVRLADRAAAIYAPAVHALALITFIGWLAFGLGWEAALTSAIAVLIITCPCALALAVPAVQVTAASRLFDKGVILKAPDALERLAEADVIVFDKTGTLTRGVPRLTGLTPQILDVLPAAAALGALSSHPYARALVAAVAAQGLAVSPAQDAQAAQDVEEVPGCGLTRGDGKTLERLGSAEWVGVDDADFAGGRSRSNNATPKSASLWYRLGDAAPTAFTFEDELKSDAAMVVGALYEAGYQVELLSGDRIAAAEIAARAAGIQRWRGAQKPKDKITRLDALAAQGHNAVMIGDGLNDAPALAAAHASLSPSSATQISQSAADVIFQGGQLAPILETLRVAKASKRMALQNFAIAAGYNSIFVPLAMAGIVTPLIAAIAMSASSIAVTANAIRLRGKKLVL